MKIHLLSLNCWGLKKISKLRRERIAAIADRLVHATPAPDIVALQECFCQEDYETLRRVTHAHLPYGKFYYSGAFGGGLVILSRWPLLESSMIAYPLNGFPTSVWHGDWYVGKGVAHAKIRFGPGAHDIVEVFNTHTHASYAKQDDASPYYAHKTAQAWEMAKLLRNAADRGHLVVAMGDFNMLPRSLAHQILTHHAPVRDVWRVLHPEDGDPETVLTAEQALMERGATSNNVLNTWRWPAEEQKKLMANIKKKEKEKKMKKDRRNANSTPRYASRDSPDPQAQRLDYIFASVGDVARQKGAAWLVEDARVGMVEPHETLGVSLSDHFSVEATLCYYEPAPLKTVSRSSSAPSLSPTACEARSEEDAAATLPPPPARTQARPSSPASGGDPETKPLHEQTPSTSPDDPKSSFDRQLRDALAATGPPENTPWTMDIYDRILATIDGRVRRQKRQKMWRMAHFFGSLFLFVVCCVSVWFVSSGGREGVRTFVLVATILASIAMNFGTVNGLIALLAMGREERALKEFAWEVANVRAAGETRWAEAADPATETTGDTALV